MPPIPDNIDDRYQIIEILGSGGMADVYLAKDGKLDRQVAIKVLDSRFAQGEEFVKRFHREAKSAAGLSHPHIVAVHDRGETGGSYYIVMEYLKGKTLDQVIEQESPLPPDKAIAITLQVLDAVGFAHENGVIHRDIKPQNIILDARGKVKVADFGIARTTDLSTRMTTAGSIIGTSHYLSPEQAAGKEVEKGSDLYSAGVMLYEILTGTVPFQGDNLMAVIHKHISEQPVPLNRLDPTIPENLSNTVLNAMAKDPGIRYRSAQEFTADLERSREGLPVPLRQGMPPAQSSASPNTIVASQVACSSCGVANPLGAESCRECGEGLDVKVIQTATIIGQEANEKPRDENIFQKNKAAFTVAAILMLALAAVAALFVISRSTESIDGSQDSPVAEQPASPEESGNQLVSSENGTQGSDSMAQESVNTMRAWDPLTDATFRGNPERTGEYALGDSIPAGSLKWRIQTEGKIYSSPAVIGETVYFGNNDNLLFAVDKSTGNEKWRFTGGDFMTSSPAVENGTVYAGSWDGNLYAIDAQTGFKKWSFRTGDSIGASPAVWDGSVFIGSWDGYVYCVDAQSGGQKWKFRTGDSVYSSPTVVDGVVYFGSNDFSFYALDAKTGGQKWQHKTGGRVNSAPAYSDGKIFFGSEDGTTYALDAGTGAVSQTYRTSGVTTTYSSVVDGSLYVGGDSGDLYSFDVGSGAINWTFKARGIPISSPTVSNGVVYFGCSQGYFYAVDAASGQKRWEYKTGDKINSTSAVIDGVVYFGSDDRALYAIQ